MSKPFITYPDFVYDFTVRLSNDSKYRLQLCMAGKRRRKGALIIDAFEVRLDDQTIFGHMTRHHRLKEKRLNKGDF